MENKNSNLFGVLPRECIMRMTVGLIVLLGMALCLSGCSTAPALPQGDEQSAPHGPTQPVAPTTLSPTAPAALTAVTSTARADPTSSASSGSTPGASRASAQISGNGTTVIRISTNESGEHLFETDYAGTGNYILWLKGGKGLSDDLLFNEIGAFQGNRSASLAVGDYHLEVVASGLWVVSISPPVQLINLSETPNEPGESEQKPRAAPRPADPSYDPWAVIRTGSEGMTVPTTELPTTSSTPVASTGPPLRTTVPVTGLPAETVAVTTPTTFSLRRTFHTPTTVRTRVTPPNSQLGPAVSRPTMTTTTNRAAVPSEARTPLQQRTWGRG